ncbi:ABC transporter ATP-binding protein [Oceanobacillus iheyensis]|uniref:ABC transporter ATP-binding protein (Daunorubicin resistance) n=1 Tax=Oceanobacillus iheyensis (strain DSM 14371 / CIP 107618 / JCM 11309 / KCTC 3954 / HTE831) TaxID=221109 RepID=Q8CXB1_OCEIH|nr:ABC transporter ATP-binding protein [Oceanobacillus iheyensis]BAC14093.1 ABC transporter ATP-binding protein (daunorubicin resistance) [Oceanobacillus iheyensis HTE831]
MISVQNLRKSYKKNVVIDQLSVDINSGDIVGLVGENGAGKSSFLRILATLSKADKGTITWNDVSYEKETKKLRRDIGFVPQEISIWEDFTVEENMKFFEKLSWVNRSESELKQLCLDMKLSKWKEPVHTLSGGMKRKLNMAISFIHDPKLLLLDEPTVGIDLKSKKEIGEYLYKQSKEHHKTIIYTSHDMDEIISLCDWVICIGKDSFYENLLKSRGKEIFTI